MFGLSMSEEHTKQHLDSERNIISNCINKLRNKNDFLKNNQQTEGTKSRQIRIGTLTGISLKGKKI